MELIPLSWAGSGDPVLDDFTYFLELVWDHLGLPPPTKAQREIARFLQFGHPEHEEGAPRRDILEGFRGVGKSYITAALVLWVLLRDPLNEKILVVSASGSKAREFVSQVKTILNTMPALAHLRPRGDQRDMADRFDVAGASISQAPSVKASGITGQITGSRATRIVADDIEIPDNTKTEDARTVLLSKTNEFEAIILPGGDVYFLGTPQSYESIYNRKVREQGYRPWVWPARFPTEALRPHYLVTTSAGRTIDSLAPALAATLDASPRVAGKPTDPERFDEVELAAREARSSRAYFALQYMLDTTLSDADRYPLRARDLIVMPVNSWKAPMTIQWGRDSAGKNVRGDIPNYGFSGDACMGPLFTDDEWRPYERGVLFVDPSGRGKDETAWAVVKVLNGTFYCPTIGGHAGDVTEGMRLAAQAARTHQVDEIQIEPNFAAGVWITAFQPILKEVWPAKTKGEPAGCSVREAEWAKGSKEARIVDTLEPAFTQHRFVLDESAARDEVTMFQLTHITRERGALRHDDRIDALAGALNAVASALALDAAEAAKEQREEELHKDIEEMIAGWSSPVRRVVRTRRGPDGKLYRVEMSRDDFEHYHS